MAGQLQSKTNQRLVDKYKEEFNFNDRKLERAQKKEEGEEQKKEAPESGSTPGGGGSFFDNISSSTREEKPETSAIMKMRDSDRRKNAETFGLPYYPARSRGRGGGRGGYRSRGYYGGHQHYAPPDYHQKGGYHYGDRGGYNHYKDYNQGFNKSEEYQGSRGGRGSYKRGGGRYFKSEVYENNPYDQDFFQKDESYQAPTVAPRGTYSRARAMPRAPARGTRGSYEQ